MKSIQLDKKKVFISLCLALIIILKLLTINYNYGGNNQGETIPIHMRMEDPNYLKNDHFANGQMSYNVRSNFAYLMYATRLVTFRTVSYPAVYFGWFLLLVVLIYIGIYKVLSTLTKSEILRLIGTAICALGASTSIGLVNLLGDQLLPGTFAGAAMVWALYYLLNKKYRFMLICIAIGMYFHLLIGLLAGLAICGAYFFANFRKDLKSVLINLILFVFTISPALLPQVLNSGSSFGGDSQKIAFVIAFFRNPHHYSPSTWPIGPILLFFSLQIIAVALTIKFEKDTHTRTSILAILFITNVMYFCGYVFVDVLTVPMIAKLQLFRISILGDLLNKALILTYCGSIFMRSQYKTSLKYLSIGFIALLICLPGLLHIRADFDYRQKPPDNKRKHAYQWIIENTPEDAVFIVPIDENNFRVSTRRATVVNFKQFVFRDDQVLDWYSRVSDLCGMKEPVCRGWDCVIYCKVKYEQYNDEDFRSLGNKYNATYILTSKNHKLGLTEVYQDKTYSIYKIK